MRIIFETSSRKMGISLTREKFPQPTSSELIRCMAREVKMLSMQAKYHHKVAIRIKIACDEICGELAHAMEEVERERPHDEALLRAHNILVEHYYSAF